MYELKKIEKVLTSKSVGTGPSSYYKRIYRATFSQSLRNPDLDDNDVLFSDTVFQLILTTVKLTYIIY